MERISKEWLEFLRQQYPKGSRIRLREMGADDPQPIKPGSIGTLEHIDDIGTFHVKWDDGRGLGLVIGQDSFTVLPPESTLLKLYMPLTAELYERNEYGDMEALPAELSGRELRAYEDKITAALLKNRMPEEAERGIMHWYDEGDSVDEKVRSAVFTVENRNGRLWGVADCQVVGTLTPEEMATLTDYISGQASDGWGEGFAQQDILVDGGSELYVHLWNSENWRVMTEEECFAPKLAEGLPELCFSTLLTTGDLICIKRGETGYYPSDWDAGDKERNVELADQLNEELGVTMWQRKAMEVGSMCGWDVPGADPKAYEQTGQKNGGMQFEPSL